MPSITIRDVPAESRDVLAARARRNGQSLQEYLKELLVATAAGPDVEEWVQEARRAVQGSGLRLTAEEIVGWRDSDRSER